MEPVECGAFEVDPNEDNVVTMGGEPRGLAVKLHATLGKKLDKFFLVSGVHRRAKDFGFLVGVQETRHEGSRGLEGIVCELQLVMMKCEFIMRSD